MRITAAVTNKFSRHYLSDKGNIRRFTIRKRNLVLTFIYNQLNESAYFFYVLIRLKSTSESLCCEAWFPTYL